MPLSSTGDKSLERDLTVDRKHSTSAITEPQGEDFHSPLPALGGSTPPKRILYVDHTAKMSGGEIALLHLLENLDIRRFVPIVVLSADGPLREKLEAAGIETHLLLISDSVLETRKDSLGISTLLRLRDGALTGGYVWALARFIRQNRIDLVHTNSLKADILGGFAARMAHTPLLWHVRDRIDEDYLPRPIVWLFRRLCHWLPNYVIANSQSTLETLQFKKVERTAAVYSGVDIATRVLVVHDGVQRAPRQAPVVYAGPHSAGLEAVLSQQDTQTPVVGIIGRISSWKGQHIFPSRRRHRARTIPTRSLSNHRVGHVSTKKLTSRRFVISPRPWAWRDCVEFLGFRNDIPKVVADLTVLVHASVTAEPFGQVIVEGMVAEKPVIATNGGGAKEIVVNGDTGLLVPMGDVAAMAEAILFLLDNPETAREKWDGADGSAPMSCSALSEPRAKSSPSMTIFCGSIPALPLTGLAGMGKMTLRFTPKW